MQSERKVKVAHFIVVSVETVQQRYPEVQGLGGGAQRVDLVSCNV